MLEIEEGFGIRRAASDMKFGAGLWLKPLSHEAFCSMDTAELRFSFWAVFYRYILHHIELDISQGRAEVLLYPQKVQEKYKDKRKFTCEFVDCPAVSEE